MKTHTGVKVGHTLKGVDPKSIEVQKRNAARKCCLCGESVAERASEGNKSIGWLEGNNPHPLGKEGDRACDPCNSIFVIPARFREFLSR
jgi:hypothetical protein